MGCGCNDYESDSGLAKTNACIPEVGESGCLSNKGKFYDILLETCVVPTIGKEFYINVCEANLWKVGMWIAVNLPSNKFAAFKITATGKQRIKLLNGLDKTGDNGIYGNPVAGTTIDKDSVIYPIIPAGADNTLATKVINILETKGIDTLIKLLASTDSICFTNIPLIDDEDGDVHLFGGTKPDCDCSDGTVYSCLRKLLKIITGQSGKTLCFPEVALANSDDDVIDGAPIAKRVAVYDGKGCLKKWKTLTDLNSCSELTSVANNTKFNSVITCLNGVRKNLAPRKWFNLFSIPDDPTLPNGTYKWILAKSGLQYFPLDAPVSLKTTAGSSVVTLPYYPHLGCYAHFRLKAVDDGLTPIEFKVNSEFIYAHWNGSTPWTLINPGGINTRLDFNFIPTPTSTPTLSISFYDGADHISSVDLELVGYHAYYPYIAP